MGGGRRREGVGGDSFQEKGKNGLEGAREKNFFLHPRTGWSRRKVAIILAPPPPIKWKTHGKFK